MYCSTCGAAAQQNLSYCNRCGAKAGAGGAPAELSPNSLLLAVAAVLAIGLATFASLLALLTRDPSGSNPFILVGAMLSFVLTFIVEAVLLWMLLRGRRGARQSTAAAAALRAGERTTSELGEAQRHALPEPMPSVTEHTTRTLEPLYSERKSK